MSLQNFLEAPESRFTKLNKLSQEDSSPRTLLLIPTRSNTPENEKAYYDNYSDKDSVSGSLTPTTRFLSSSSSSMSSVDFPEGSSFEIDVCPKRKRFSNPDERRQFVEEYKRKYKTEMCKNWELRGTCKFGDKCCFAHGRDELKAKVLTHVKYKTKPCKQYHQTGYCPYGQRCQYLHKEAVQPNVFCNPAEGRHKHNPQIYDILHEVNRLCSTDVELKAVLDKFPKRSRLSVFQKIAIA
jgi:hypothetical protein